jgi:cell pole-organizing protein PopZ
MLVTPPTKAASAPPIGMDDASGLIAPAAAAAAAASVGSLLRAVSSERGSQVYRGGPSIEDVVREEIRPILKDWLDTHLPPLVERLVRAEIERVVNRALP